jgi:hypothetical protein
MIGIWPESLIRFIALTFPVFPFRDGHLAAADSWDVPFEFLQKGHRRGIAAETIVVNIVTRAYRHAAKPPPILVTQPDSRTKRNWCR